MNLELVNDLIKDIDLSKETKTFGKIVTEVINRGSEYVIKAMPIQDNIKDVLIDVNKSLQTKDFGKIVHTAVTSSVREGIEFISAPIDIVKDISKITDVALKGGLREGLSAAVDIVLDKHIKNNLLADVISNYKEDIKNFINSKNFTNKLSGVIEKMQEKQNSIKSLFESWKENYENFDLNKINELFSEIKSKKNVISSSSFLKNEFKFINNVMEFVNNKQEKLSEFQLETCRII